MSDLTSNTLFGALTTPPMMMGVTLEAYGVNLMVAVSALIATGNIFYALIFLPMHIVSWAICKNDVALFKIIKIWMQLPNIENKKIWGARCYEPY